MVGWNEGQTPHKTEKEVLNMINYEEGIMLYIDFVRHALKTRMFGNYYDFVRRCVDCRNEAKTEHMQNYYRLMRLICLLCFDSIDNNNRQLNLTSWKRIVRAYLRMLHSV